MRQLQFTTRRFRIGLIAAGCVILAGVAGAFILLMQHGPAATSPTTSTGTTINGPVTHWMMTGTHIALLKHQDPAAASYFFDTPDAFSMGPNPPETKATRVDVFTSYAAFSQQVAAGQIPHTTTWVMYDNESWQKTPRSESQRPSIYMPRFAELAHAHGYKVIETPAAAIQFIKGSECNARKGESIVKSFLDCKIPYDARDADVFEIQSQPSQHNEKTFVNLVRAAQSQAAADNPHQIVLAGLTTDRGDSAATIFACWQATHGMVSGYWMNTNASSFSEAQQVFDMIREAGGH